LDAVRPTVLKPDLDALGLGVIGRDPRERGGEALF
jgi:hypothetical protein